MGKTALVLSGGGAKGAFQVAVEKYAREEKGYHWDVIAGVSVGALNGAMLAMEKFDRLDQIWKTLSNRCIYTGKWNIWAAIRLLFGAKSIYSNEPLREIIQGEVEPHLIKADLRVGAVSLSNGNYTMYRKDDPNIKHAILASTVMPIIWPPQHVSPQCQYMVDGSLRRFSPIGDVLDADPDEVIIISCRPQKPGIIDRPFKNILDIGIRTYDIASDEIVSGDIREFRHINRNVHEAAEGGVTLHNVKGKPYKEYRCKVIEPVESLGSMLDFSHDAIKRSMRIGRQRAKEVLG